MPDSFVAYRVYSAEASGYTVLELTPMLTGPTPWLIAIVSAPSTLQLRVTGSPGLMTVGAVKVKLLIVGRAARTVTSMLLDVEPHELVAVSV